jgi:YbbR domain-containing protein
MSFGRTLKRLPVVIFFEDIPLKIVCLILAVLFWFYIDGELTDEREVVRPITSADLPLPKDRSMEVLSELDLPEVTLSVRGPRRRLQYLSARDVQVDLREALKDLKRGPQLVALSRQSFSIDGMDVTHVAPSEFTLVLTQTTERTLTVLPATTGEVPHGYTLKKAEAEPQQVQVKTKEDFDFVENLNIRTEPINVRGRTSTFKAVVPLARSVQAGDREVPVDCGEKVTVTITIEPEDAHRPLDDVPVRTLTPPGTSMTLDPPTVSIRVSGSETDVAPLRNTDVQVYVEWPDDWSLQGPAGKTFPARSVQVKVFAPPRVKVSGSQDSALPTVKVQGKLTQSSAGW